MLSPVSVLIVGGGVGAPQMAHVRCSVLNAKDYLVLFPEQGYNFTLATVLCGHGTECH